MIVVPTATSLHPVFDVLAWSAAAATGRAVHRWRLGERALAVARATGPGYFAALAVGGAIGAWASGSLNTLRDAVPSLSHSILGALVGSVAGVELYKLARGIRLSTGAIFVAPFAVGAAIGRWGCLFAGLPDRTYGTPTALPWAVDLGDGIGRHPVHVYESLAMAAFLAVYLVALHRRADWATTRSFQVMCIWYGAQRFAWEFLKPYPPVLGPLNLFHLLCGALIAYGCLVLLRGRRQARPAPAQPTGAEPGRAEPGRAA